MADRLDRRGRRRAAVPAPPVGAGPAARAVPRARPKGASKNRLHLDVRLETGEEPDELEAAITERGGARLHTDWGDLPWRSYLDPSGNEFCILPARA